MYSRLSFRVYLVDSFYVCITIHSQVAVVSFGPTVCSHKAVRWTIQLQETLPLIMFWPYAFFTFKTFESWPGPVKWPCQYSHYHKWVAALLSATIKGVVTRVLHVLDSYLLQHPLLQGMSIVKNSASGTWPYHNTSYPYEAFIIPLHIWSICWNQVCRYRGMSWPSRTSGLKDRSGRHLNF